MELVNPAKGLLCSGCSKPWDPETANQCAKCQAVHCAQCITQHAKCLSCNNSSDETFTKLPRLVRALAEGAQVRCGNSSLGCEWIGTRTEYKKHLCKKAASTKFKYVEESRIPDELKCVICTSPFVEPVELPCEHIFCRTCILTTLVLKHECPVDRESASSSQLHPAPKLIEDMVNELPVFCQNANCKWVGPRASLSSHDATCDKKNTQSVDCKMTVEAVTEHASFNAVTTTPEDIYTLAHVVAPRLKDLNERKKPLSISAVIDVSGSMSGSKLQMAKDSLKFMIDELTDRDELGIIAFHTDIAETIVLTKMDEAGKERCRRAADSLRALNRTNLSGGLFAGMDQVQGLPFLHSVHNNHYDPHPRNTRRGWRGGLVEHPVEETCELRQKCATKRASCVRPLPVAADSCRAVLLFTDGIANGGLTQEHQFKAALQGKMEHHDTKDMVVHTFGFGADHNAGLLQGLAEIASGSYYYIQDVATMKESFADCLGGLLSTVAQNIKLTVQADKGFKVVKVLTSFKQEIKGDTTVVSLKDLYSTEKRDVLVQLKPQGEFAVSSTAVPAVNFSVKYDSLLSGTSETVTCAAMLVPANANPEGEPNKTILEQRTRIETTEALAAARKQADAGDVLGAKLMMKAKRKEMKTKCAESEYVTAMLDDMAEVEDAMESESMWCAKGSKAMVQVQSCHEQQRMNRACEAKSSLGYDNEWKAAMRCKSRK